MVSRLLSFVIVTVFVTASAWAQSDAGFDYEAWDATAIRAEQTISNALASTPALETLRGVLAESRRDLTDLKQADADRIATIKAQLDALGPVLEDPSQEDPEIATRRKVLNDQLAEASKPIQAASEAFERADGMIGEIDTIIRERQAEQLFKLGESPLKPSLWLTSLSALSKHFSQVRLELFEMLGSRLQGVIFRQNLPLFLVLLAAALLIPLKGSGWAERLLLRGIPSFSGLTAFTMRVITLFLPLMLALISLYLFRWSLTVTGYFGIRGDALISDFYWLFVTYLTGNWLARALFVRDDNERPILPLLEAVRGSAVRQVSWLAAAVAIHNFVNSITSSGDFPEFSNAVLNFPVIVIAAWSLYLLAGCVVQSEAAQLPAAEQPFRVSALRVLARGIRVIAVLAPVIAAIGYSTASVSFVFPLVQTLAILGGLLVSQWLFSGLVDLSFRDPGASHKMTAGLVNTLVGFALFCMALPMIALLWGARVADLTEIWTLIQSGIQIGNRQLTPTNFLTFAIVFSIGYTLTRLLQGALRSSVLPNTQLDSGGRNAVLTGVGYLGILIAAISAITAAGIDLSGLAIVAGALSVGIGFGLQAIVGNFVSGIILLIERPIKQGDWVEVGSYSGYVKSINVRSTQIETFDRATVIVPNGDLIAGTVTNYTHGDDVGRLILGVGVAYGTDPRRVEAILLELARAHPRIQQIPGPGVVFRNFGADSLDFEIRAILKDVNYVMSVRSELNFQICEKFAQEGIEMPFAQRDIHLKDIDKLASAISGIPEKK